VRERTRTLSQYTHTWDNTYSAVANGTDIPSVQRRGGGGLNVEGLADGSPYLPAPPPLVPHSHSPVTLALSTRRHASVAPVTESQIWSQEYMYMPPPKKKSLFSHTNPRRGLGCCPTIGPPSCSADPFPSRTGPSSFRGPAAYDVSPSTRAARSVRVGAKCIVGVVVVVVRVHDQRLAKWPPLWKLPKPR
jgi:hypothetical protein